MPDNDDNRENENEKLDLFPNELDRLAIDDTDDGTVPDVDEVETREDMTDGDKREQTNDTAEKVGEVMDGLTHEGFITDGLTRNETLALLGMTLMSYGFAWGLLRVMVEEGLHTVPFTLWALFAVLIVVPLMLLFGAEVVNRLVNVFIR